jgi:hypothetical protein
MEDRTLYSIRPTDLSCTIGVTGILSGAGSASAPRVFQREANPTRTVPAITSAMILFIVTCLSSFSPAYLVIS